MEKVNQALPNLASTRPGFRPEDTQGEEHKVERVKVATRANPPGRCSYRWLVAISRIIEIRS